MPTISGVATGVFVRPFTQLRNYPFAGGMATRADRFSLYWDTGSLVAEVAALSNALVTLGRTVANGVSPIDARAAEAMVLRMRGRVAVDTGRLYAGIGWTRLPDGVIEVKASAVRGRGTRAENADYARFVEFGTRPGRRGARVAGTSRVGFFGGDNFGFEERGRPQGRARKQYRSHPGTPARPFFFNSAREVLAKRAGELTRLADDAVRAAGD